MQISKRIELGRKSARCTRCAAGIARRIGGVRIVRSAERFFVEVKKKLDNKHKTLLEVYRENQIS